MIAPTMSFSNRQSIRESAYSDGFVELFRADGFFKDRKNLEAVVHVPSGFAGNGSLRIQIVSYSWPHDGPASRFHDATEALYAEELQEQHIISLPLLKRDDAQRFLRLRYVVNGRFTRGALTAYIRADGVLAPM